MWSGLWLHFRLTLRLNFRSGRAIAYGFLMPVLFLFGFGSVFRSGDPLLLHQMGQILTITILGGCCMGMPTALVAERERGLWRRYQLLPVSSRALLGNVLAVRIVLVAIAVLIQVVLARLIYGTPFPAQPLPFVIGFLFAVFAFLGLGLVITALARDVPAVQALGQCVFLPMILVGGVGVPLAVLPEWARVFAGFMPGRYAVAVLQAPYAGEAHATGGAWFALGALAVIGAVSAIAGFRLLDQNLSSARAVGGWRWAIVSLLAWFAVGGAAVTLDKVAPGEDSELVSAASITPEMIAGIRFDGLPEDDGIYTPLGPPLEGRRLSPRMREFLPRLEEWAPGRGRDVGASVRLLVSVAAIADIAQDPAERDIARAVFEYMQRRYPEPALQAALAWVILAPEAGPIKSVAPELGLSRAADPGIVRERSGWYARKFLGRLRGQIADTP